MSADSDAVGAGCCILGSCYATFTAAHAVVGTAFGYLGAYTFAVATPPTGAIFGATFALVNACANALFAGCCNRGHFTCGSAIVSAVIAAFSTKLIMEAAFGIVMTGNAVLILTGAAVSAGLIVAAAACCCCGAMIFGATAAAAAA